MRSTAFLRRFPKTLQRLGVKRVERTNHNSPFFLCFRKKKPTRISSNYNKSIKSEAAPAR